LTALTCSHKKKRMKQLKKMSQRGLLDPEQEDPFALFVASTNIRYCYYNETQNILGNTYGMAVLQVCLMLVAAAGTLKQ
jgi:N-acetyltransferase 10